MGEIGEITEGFWEVGREWGFRTTEGKFQSQRCSSWYREVIEKNGMRWLGDDLKRLKLGEGYHPLSRNIAGAGDRIAEVNVADARSRLEKVE